MDVNLCLLSKSITNYKFYLDRTCIFSNVLDHKYNVIKLKLIIIYKFLEITNKHPILFTITTISLEGIHIVIFFKQLRRINVMFLEQLASLV